MGFTKRGLGHSLDGFGFLVPRKEKKKILGALWDSSVFPNRAPTDHALIRVMIGGSRQPELALKREDELFEIALSSLRSIMGIRHYPEFVKVFRYPKGIPHYTVGHIERVERIGKLLSRHPGLYLNSNAYRGIGLNDCVHNGFLTAQLISSE
jgi:oxygen-dependent protoporphyrinogen oxidase